VKEVVIYTKDWCSYCDSAKALLKRKNVPFIEIDVTHDEELQKEAVMLSGGGMTVPQIFIDGVSIGGSDELTRSRPRVSSTRCSRATPSREPTTAW
jgi:glutaredoxin 3